MTRLWTRSLAAQIVALMLLALAVSQGIAVLIFWDERGQALWKAAKSEFLSRTASLAEVIEASPAALRQDMIDASATSYTRFWVSPAEPLDGAAWQREAVAQIARPLPTLTRKPRRPEAELAEPARTTGAMAAAADTRLAWTPLPAWAWPLSRPAKFLRLDGPDGMGLAVRLDSGDWLNAAFVKKMSDSPWTSKSMVSLAVTAAILSLIAVFVAGRIARPMRRLAKAAEALGRGESVAPLPESGPDDIRHTAEAFNRMQERLQRFVEDRTRMLAAIGHDLRTPLTSLRLRAEFVADAEAQEKMLATIEEMRTMTEAALAFAREEAAAEDTRTVDLPALVGSLCDDLAELGHDVTFLEGTTVKYRCRPDALRRAVRNLVENAVRYGERARVRLARTGESIDVVVEDDGPGIPGEAIEQVFAPFFRIETSRNRETGGVGLGLSIARTIARHHGGDVRLANATRGLQATISLPLVA
ncbi:ATP-binding protein [Labrys wisconsinensis]|uniref:histidine kinase n=1 Tax=Labrys wisconsinensis TaxID=425677 RepID=A0ABU0JCJ6_9HYPH|nr:ATP-binding protein [Labrys wisconsinensis]MDQ0472012.1 signal transduction histidine kinase [Labrys wisconsinensis]